jgi:hypothetical protein
VCKHFIKLIRVFLYVDIDSSIPVGCPSLIAEGSGIRAVNNDFICHSPVLMVVFYRQSDSSDSSQLYPPTRQSASATSAQHHHRVSYCRFLSARLSTYSWYSFSRRYAYSLRVSSDEGIKFFRASSLLMISSEVSLFASLFSEKSSASISSRPITATCEPSMNLSVRRLTVGASGSPHVIHPITSNNDILHLFNCFFISPAEKLCAFPDRLCH